MGRRMRMRECPFRTEAESDMARSHSHFSFAFTSRRSFVLPFSFTFLFPDGEWLLLLIRSRINCSSLLLIGNGLLDRDFALVSLFLKETFST